MQKLKDATEFKHKIAEKMPFNVKMFNGELSNEEYIRYLFSQLEIFTSIEANFKLPHAGLNRTYAVIEDLKSLGIQQLESGNAASIRYGEYLRSLDQDTIMAHVYLNYLAIMFGGQMMKANTPGAGNMYEFQDMKECAGAIRAIQKDEWAAEVNKGFDFMIEIFKELENDV